MCRACTLGTTVRFATASCETCHSHVAGRTSGFSPAGLSNAEGPRKAALHRLVEAAGIEPASENATQSGLHA